MTCSAVSARREALGLDDPLPVQYATFMGDFLQGDWGQSQRTDRSVAESIRDDLWETSQLAFWGCCSRAASRSAVGVYSASRPYSRGDYLFTGLAFAGIAMPTFWFGLLTIQYLTFELQQLFGTTEPIFYSIPNPVASGAVEYFRELALPGARALGAARRRMEPVPALVDARGAQQRLHPHRAAPRASRDGVSCGSTASGTRSTALVTIVAIDVGVLFGGLIITERIFSRPGMGTLLLSAVNNGDTQIVLPWMLVVGAIIVVFNLARRRAVRRPRPTGSPVVSRMRP